MAKKKGQQQGGGSGRPSGGRPAPRPASADNSVVWALMSHGYDLSSAQRFAANFNSVDDVQRWANTWGRIDWSQNTGPGGNPVTAPTNPPPDDPGPDQDTINRRNSVYDSVMRFFDSLGLPGEQMSQFIKGQAEQDKKDWEIVEGVRQQDWYNNIFAGLNELRKRGANWNEAKYIEQREAYKTVLSNKAFGLPSGFYDQPEDFAQWMLNDVSPAEVERRVTTAANALKQADPNFKKSLRDMYGVGDDGMLAYMLDPTKATGIIDQQVRAATIAKFALDSQRSLDKATAERIANSTGAVGIDSLSTAGQEALQQKMGQATALDKADSVLAGIDGENYSYADSVDAVFGDAQKQLASQQRSKREQARFSGSSAVAKGSLSKKRGY